MSTPSGSLVDDADYNVLGSSPNAPGSVFGYAGQLTDSTGLGYTPNRLYDSSSGSFNGVDALGQNGSAQGYYTSSYSYTAGFPLTLTDASGLCSAAVQSMYEPCESKTTWSSMYRVHNTLDAAGFVPVAGWVADGLSVAVSLATGDVAGAGLSAVGFIPEVGDGIKMAAKTARRATTHAVGNTVQATAGSVSKHYTANVRFNPDGSQVAIASKAWATDSGIDKLWDMEARARGYAIEPFFTGSHAMKAPNYPTIDAYDYSIDHATSVKSINVFDNSYRGNSAAMTSRLRSYARHLDAFDGAKKRKTDLITPGMTKSKELIVAVHPDAFSDEAFKKTMSDMQDYVNTLNKNNNISISLNFRGIM